ncbi:MAG: polyribonucleotide nucleotidyltransferase [Candidatus Dojkabacteria bacterium]
MSIYTQTISINGKNVEIETGKLAMLSHGSIKLTMGGTVLLANVTVDSKDTDLDYFPLSVEYIEKFYASGMISSSRFQKREGRPTDEATIKAREVDHSIRSLFPKSFKKPVSVVLTVLAYDGINDPQSLTVIGASLALLQSGIPFAGPCSSVVVSVKEDLSFVINEAANKRENDIGEFIISGVDGKILSFEGWGKELSEDLMGKILDEADKVIREINAAQNEFKNSIKPSLEFNPDDFDNRPAPAELIESLKAEYKNRIKEALYAGRSVRSKEISEIINEAIENNNAKEESKFSSSEVAAAIDYIARGLLREGVLKEGKRVSGRKLDEIRPLSAEIDVLPTVHGSALFSRGETQSLSIVTLGSKNMGQLMDEMEGEETKMFMHHYNFPPFSTGEAKRYSYYPGRREIGHGAIGENALKNMIPLTDDFPYTIRAVSEILSSNGSTSMAATCSSSLALMAAGVPIKEQVAGIGVGLVTNDENINDYRLLLDIEGIEDFYGDMDFKVAGTKNGITAIQYENKLQGVPLAILKEAFKLAKEGRMQVLEVMNAAISKPRVELAASAPKVEKIKIETDEIAELIGPGGKVIKQLIEESKQLGNGEADINIEQDGTVYLSATNSDQMNFLKNKIAKMFEKPEVGKVYEGVVAKVESFGAFIDVSNKISGLLHVSEMSDKFVKDANEVIKAGEKVKVKILKVDEKGRINFTRKGINN